MNSYDAYWEAKRRVETGSYGTLEEYLSIHPERLKVHLKAEPIPYWRKGMVATQNRVKPNQNQQFRIK